MLSFGIRFGEGFDGTTLLKLMQSIPKDFDYDILVIGSNPGGVACAKEASLAGKKTAIVTSKSYSPAEAEGFDEDLQDMADVLESHEQSGIIASETQFSQSATKTLTVSQSKVSTVNKSSKKSNSRKVRGSRLDLCNELFKRGQQCRKLMHNAIRLGNLIQRAQNSGWRLTTIGAPLSINWNKMSEEIMDFVMKENWTLMSELSEGHVEVIEGSVIFEDNHTLKIIKSDKSETECTAGLICLALPTESILPEDIAGAQKYGITCDDFIRMAEPPGKTLVVGSLPESLEIAGIVACARFPVTVVSRSRVLKGYDADISKMIVLDLIQNGVVFKEQTTLVSIEMNSDKKLLATFEPLENAEQVENSKENEKESFDTIIFAVGRRLFIKDLNVTDLGVELDPISQKIQSDIYAATAVPNIYAVGEAQADYPENFEISLLSGKLLGKRLFHVETELMNYSMIPLVMYTPTEYAFIGISEDAAMFRLGNQCVDVYSGHFKPLDFVIPPKKGECFAKVIVLKKTDEIIGLHFFGPDAGEIIQGFAAAMKTGLTIKKFQTIVGVTATKAQEILKLKETSSKIVTDEENLLTA